jgi:hypothetical protein
MNTAAYTSHPRAVAVTAMTGHVLRVRFANGDVRDYDFTPHLALRMFDELKNESVFRSAVKVDSGGFGLSWSDDMDIAASEIWLNGSPNA